MVFVFENGMSARRKSVYPGITGWVTVYEGSRVESSLVWLNFVWSHSRTNLRPHKLTVFFTNPVSLGFRFSKILLFLQKKKKKSKSNILERAAADLTASGSTLRNAVWFVISSHAITVFTMKSKLPSILLDFWKFLIYIFFLFTIKKYKYKSDVPGI